MDHSTRGLGANCACVVFIIMAAVYAAAANSPVLAGGPQDITVDGALTAPPFRTLNKVKPRQFGACLTTLTQSSSQSVNTWIACLDSSTGYSHANSYWRAFNAADHGIGPDDAYMITSVDIGIFTAEAGSATQPLTVNLYTTANFPAGYPSSLTLIGTTTVQVADQANTLLNVPITAEVPAGSSQIVLEVAVPDGISAENLFMMGGNTGNETGPSYISAPSCAVTTPTTTSDAGFPTVHWVMNINGSCAASNSISGTVTYAHADPVKPVPGTALSGNGLPAVFQATGFDGSYTLSGFGEGSYTITPSKPNVVPSTPNGIFANDAALIARHVVGLTTLNSTQQAAARVSGGTELSSLDAAFIARWIVGLNSGPNQTGQWKFTPANRVYESIEGDQTDQNYSALLMGDVNGDWAPPVSRAISSAGRNALLWETVTVSAPSMTVKGGGLIAVPVRIDNLLGKAVSSFQFNVEFDPAVMTPDSVGADLVGTMGEGLNVVSYSPRPGLLKIVVYGVADVNGEGTYVNLRFSSRRGRGSSPIKISEFRLNDGSEKITMVNGKITVE